MGLSTVPSRIVAFVRDRARRLTHGSHAATSWYARLFTSARDRLRRLLRRPEPTPWYKRPLHR